MIFVTQYKTISVTYFQFQFNFAQIQRSKKRKEISLFFIIKLDNLYVYHLTVEHLRHCGQEDKLHILNLINRIYL